MIFYHPFVLLKIYGASTASYGKKVSSTYQYRQDGGGSKQNRVRTANSQLKNEHGRSFFSVPAGVFCSRLVVSERTRMAVVISSSEICVMHKSRR